MRKPDPRENDPRYKKIYRKCRRNPKTKQMEFPKRGTLFVMYVKVDSEAK